MTEEVGRVAGGVSGAGIVEWRLKARRTDG
jgi:hypothetical protein